MGLPRPPGDFDRIYSPPEPPETARRPRLVRLLLPVMGAVAVAVAAVFLLLPSGEEERGAPAPRASRGGTPASANSSSPAPSSAGPIYTALPPACRSVSAETVRRLVPRAERTSSGNTTFGYCGFGSPPSAEAKDRWLQIDSRLYPAAGAVTPVDSARRHFDIKWALAGKATEERTVTLERQSGLGEQAYRWFKVDRQRPLAIGEVAVRSRNVVITVSYSERTVGAEPSAAQRQRCLTEATAVAREVLESLP
ncbi:hypothetical protein SAMN04489712_102395 [Thermomonospora echinospora]|uniref:DUF3558 domain-containing protein n=1 Tax=Thermomonospora echinospora TaxID=1992 RepID=A0A1H5VQU0_9ACTN|nr:hypothetical protein [Thermomonospora echinospora]SEF88897.1 hypothetical protein SAMN04489712_102395 [Thermomonospora echinospora]